MQEKLELSLYITVKSKDSDSVLHFIWFGEAYTQQLSPKRVLDSITFAKLIAYSSSSNPSRCESET